MPAEDYCDELDGLLAAEEADAPGLDELHGFISAALCGPRVLSFSECVCAVFLPEAGDDAAIEHELPARLIQLLKQLYEETKRSIDDGSFLPIVSCAQDDEGGADAGQWCRGFLACMEQGRARWKLDNDRVLELVTPVVLLGDEREFERALGQITAIGVEDFKQQLLEELSSSVCGLGRLFRRKPSGRRPVRRRGVKKT